MCCTLQGSRTRNNPVVCSSVSRPVNLVIGLRSTQFSVADLQQLGVRRISLGSALVGAGTAGLGASLAREISSTGTFARGRCYALRDGKRALWR